MERVDFQIQWQPLAHAGVPSGHAKKLRGESLDSGHTSNHVEASCVVIPSMVSGP